LPPSLGIARKALTVFQTYIEMMNEDVKAAFQHVRGSALKASGLSG
jgi:hypothetical protein